MTTPAPLRLFNSLTRQIQDFVPVHEGEARVYTCGPTVYNYQHIGNMRAYIFADTLGRVLSYKGYKLKHVINITDVGHLTSDADAGDDKMEKAAAAAGQSAWDIAAFYRDAYWEDVKRLNIRQPAHWSIATDYVPAMIDYAKGIADKHCYELEGGLYFDTSTVADYGRLARAATEDGEGRIDAVDGKRHAADFAIWRKTPAGETRQMEWDSPWGRGAPGWHLECSVMSEALLGLPFDIHTGGIDHREIHHPNEIAQNQAHSGCDHSGARIWMHNNFLIDRGGKMSKSSGEFLRLQVLIDRGFHPMAYRLMCLQAHYRSELEFSWLGLLASHTQLQRWIKQLEKLAAQNRPSFMDSTNSKKYQNFIQYLDEVASDELNTPKLLAAVNGIMFDIELRPVTIFNALHEADKILGLGLLNAELVPNLDETPRSDLSKNPMTFAANGNLFNLTREDLRIRPITATITEAEIEAALAARKEARAAKDFATSDAIRDELIAKGVEVMDGDPLGWDWRLEV